MKEHPIIMTAESVRGILAGRKTQTRRVIKLPRGEQWALRTSNFDHGEPIVFGDGDGVESDICRQVLRCPYGYPGDRIWVKESWRPWGWRDDEFWLEYNGGDKIIQPALEDPRLDEDKFQDWASKHSFRASQECVDAGCEMDAEGCYVWPDDGVSPVKWRTPLFMPRWASRITLEITDIRTERLQDISLEDCQREGILLKGDSHHDGSAMRDAYRKLWDSINARRGFGWDKNPFVWVIEFKLIEKGVQ